MGGYARGICDLLLNESNAENPAVRLAAVCDPDLDAHAPKVAQLRERGVKVLRRYEDLLAEPIEAVWLPVPIDLHRPFTEQALSAGKAVMCEKPAAGAVDDLDAMLAARDRSKLPLAFGFQDIYDPSTLAVKQRLLAGVIGRVQSATLHACWPRGEDYYRRNTWAGRFQRNGVWVMDSPASNALAHFINLALFWMGEDERGFAKVESVQAELYRGNPVELVENYDTCSMRLVCRGGATLLVLLTHACRQTVPPQITLHGTSGVFRFKASAQGEFAGGGKSERIDFRSSPSRSQMVRHFARWARGDASVGPVATGEMARNHLAVVNAASEATAVHNVPDEFVEAVAAAERSQNSIRDVEELFTRCADARQMLSESGLAPWATSPGERDVRNDAHFAGPAGWAPGSK